MTTTSPARGGGNEPSPGGGPGRARGGGDRRARRGRDLIALCIAALLLAGSAITWFAWNARARARREEVLAGVPDFPARGEVQRRRPFLPPRPAAAADLPAPARRQGPPPGDRLNAFALAPAHTVAVVQVNALLSSPLFARLRACAPKPFRDLEDHARDLGLELDRDIDRVALVPDGMAVSGFFEGKPVVQKLLGLEGGAGPAQDYRGAQLFAQRGTCIAQLGNLILAGPANGCEALVDRALSPEPTSAAAGEIYGDVYVRSDLSVLRSEGGAALPGPFDGLVHALSGATVRANVWDEVALTLDGAPAAGQSAQTLAQLASGALALAKSQIGGDDVELQTLSQLAKVSGEGGALHSGCSRWRLRVNRPSRFVA